MKKMIAVALAIAITATVGAAQATQTTTKPVAKTATQTSKTATQTSKTTKSRKSAKKAESQEALQKEAQIPEATARATALKEVANGTVKSSELEREKGRLIYSYDITVPGKAGVQEVNVDAKTGAVVAKVRESAKTEAKEAAKEAKGKKIAKK